MRVIKNPRRILAHWVYTREEWSRYRRWERRRAGWFSYLFGRFVSNGRQAVPEATITGETVSINGRTEAFMGDSFHLRRVHLRESGDLNILEIVYHSRGGRFRIIRIPVPRGCLRQAIEVQECLSGYVK